MTSISTGLSAPKKTLSNSLSILLDRSLTPKQRGERAAVYLTYTLCADMGELPPSMEELMAVA